MITFCFGKYTKEVCKKFYVQFWSSRKAAKLSWKCYKMYTSEIENKAIEQRGKILENKRMPEIDDIETWITNRINILKLPGTEVEDPGLLDSVELHFHRLNG